MELVNIKSLSFNKKLDESKRNILLKNLRSPIKDDTIYATDDLEIIFGKNLWKKAIEENKKLLPLVRIAQDKKIPDFPQRVLLELTTNCNSHCTMCPRNVMTRVEQDLETKTAKRLITELAQFGLNGLWLYNIGESLLHPDFFEILDHVRKCDNLGTIWSSTNGKLIDAEMRKKILETPVDIQNYSLNAYSKELYDKVAPNLVFDDIQNNFIELAKLKKQMGVKKPILRAQMFEYPGFEHEIDKFIDKFQDFADIVSINKLELFSQNIDNLSSGEEIILNEKIDKCNRLLKQTFYIFSDGTVSCCATDFDCVLNIGNVYEQSIQEIFNGEKYQNLLKKHNEGTLHEVELCSKCRDYHL